MTYTSSLQPSSLFTTTYSLSIRIWHWLTFLTIAASMITVLFASTMFTTKSNIPVVQEQIQRKGGAVSPEQARAVAHEYSDKLWNLHKYTGYGLCFLLLCRMVLEAAYSKEKRLGSKIRNALRFKSGSQQNDRQHYLMVKYGYVIFYLLFLVMAVTGLGLAYEDVPFLRTIHKPISSIHSFTQYLMYAYVLFHIIGVIRADVTRNKGIVSAMINGNLL